MSFAAPAKPDRDVPSRGGTDLRVNRPFYWVRPPQPVLPGMRIGILGGSFNPPHRGHLYASELALRQLALDSVWWLVSPQNPLKPMRGMASFAERVAAARRFVHHRRILVSDIEALFGTRFTIDTLRSLTRRFPHVHFVWLMGSDNLVQLPRWRSWQRIFTLAPIAVVARPGSATPARKSLAARRFAFAYRKPSRGFPGLLPPAWTILEGPRDAASATAIRALEARLRAATVGEQKPLTGPIVLKPSDPEWPTQFSVIENLISQALGRKALLVEHVGSTSVPGLAAKPIIDIVLAVRDSANEAEYIPTLESAGFVLRVREPNWFQHRMLKTPCFDGNLHVFSQGCEEIATMIRFRDWLRNNRDDRENYEHSKRELASQHWTYMQEYADAKSAVIRAILENATCNYHG